MAYNTLEYIKGLRRNMEQKKAEIVGGIILVAIGVKILVEHLGILSF